MKRFTWATLLMCMVLITVLSGKVSAADPVEITDVYQDFCDLSQFTLNNSAAINNPGGTGTLVNDKYLLRLTRNVPNESASAFLTKQISLAGGRSFSAYFTFSMRLTGYTGADGITFTVQTKANNVGANGGGMGYAGIQPSIAVEFDNWYNPEFLDPDDNHVGININGDIRSKVTATPPGSLESGSIWHAWVDYNGTTKMLEVRMSQVNNARPADPVLTYPVDLQKVLNMDEVFIGFTSGTGRAYGLQDIHTFYFNNDYTPIDTRTIVYYSGREQVDVAIDQAVGPVGKRQVTALVTDANNQPVANRMVHFSTNFGTVGAGAVTDANGVATVFAESNTAGKGTIRAKLRTGRYDTQAVEYQLINKAPSFVKGADQKINENGIKQQTILNWATAIKPGPTEEAAQKVTFLVETDRPDLFTVQPVISPTGTLTYTPVGGQTGTATVSVRLKDDGGTLYGGVDTSDVQTFMIQVDTIDPVSTMTAQANSQYNGWYTSAVTVNWNATDVGFGVDYTEYRINGGNWTKVIGPVSLGANNTYAFDYRAVDKLGNVETAQSQTIKVDRTPPVTTATTTGTAGENGWHTSDVTLNFNSTDAYSGVLYTEYRINGGAWTRAAEVVLKNNGIYTVDYRGVDNARLVEVYKSQTVRIDKSAPLTSLNVDAVLGHDGWLTSEATLNWKASDTGGSGVAYTEYRLDAGVWTKVTGPLALSLDGIHEVEYRSKDNAGNVETTLLKTLRIDRLAPVTSLNSNATLGNNEWSTSDVTLVWEATDAGIGVDYTEYRINAGEWTKVTEPLVLSNDGTYTVEYRSVDKTGNVETTQSKTVQIDRVAPETSLTVNSIDENDGWYTSDAILLWDAADANSGVAYTEYRINGGEWTKMTGQVTLTESGTYLIEYRSVDNNGNVEVVKSQTVQIDKVTPLTKLTVTATGREVGWYASDATLDFDATDAGVGVAYTEYRINGSEWVRAAGPLVLTQDGAYVVEYRSVDKLGNVETTLSETVRIDQIAPETSLTVDATSANKGWYASDARLNFAGTDAGVGVEYTEYRINGGEWTRATAPVALADEGIHVVEYRSVDKNGNVEDVKSQTVQIDKAAPLTTLTVTATGPAVGWYTSDATLDFDATDDGAGVAYTEYRINGSEWVRVAGPLVLTQDGTYVVEYRSVDKLGNVETTLSETVRIDRIAPETSLTVDATGANNGWYASDARLNFAGTDTGVGVDYTEYRINGGAWTRATAPVTLANEGIHVVEYRSVDKNGNAEDVKSQTVKIDKAAPLTTLTVTATGPEVGWYTSDATLDFDATDAGVGVAYTEYRINGSAWVRVAGPLVLTQDGTYVVEYRSVDKLGNVETTVSETVRIDRIAPETSLTVDATAANNGWYTSDAKLNFAGNDAGVGVAYTEYRINGGAWTRATAPVTLANEGIYVVEYRSVDKNGNVEDVKSQTVQIDKYAPVTTVTTTSTSAVSGGYTTDATLNFSATDTGVGVAYTEYRINGGAWVKVTGPLVLNTDGTHVVEYRSVDKNGNVETAKSQTVSIDKTAPVTSLTVGGTSGSDGWYKSNATLNFTSTDAGVGVAYTEYRINGGAWVKVTGPLELTADGTYVVEYRSVDKFGNVESTQSKTVQIDRTAPVVEIKLSQEILWSPNHKYEPVRAVVTTNDPTASIVLTSITSNEIEDHMHDGVAAPDVIEAAFGTYDLDFQVCVERDGTNKEGRIYTVTYTVTDKAGNVTVAKAYLHVPHSKGGSSK